MWDSAQLKVHQEERETLTSPLVHGQGAGEANPWSPGDIGVCKAFCQIFRFSLAEFRLFRCQNAGYNPHTGML